MVETTSNDDMNQVPLEPEKLSVYLEAILFVAEAPVTIGDLAQAVDGTVEQVEAGLKALETALESRGLALQRMNSRIQMVTAPNVSVAVERFLGLDLSASLSSAALETLVIVAYRQPVTRMEIDDLRGVNSSGVLRTLEARELIEEAGRLDTVGHPKLYGTTFRFLEYFGLNSLDDLPQLDTEEAAALFAELEAEHGGDEE